MFPFSFLNTGKESVSQGDPQLYTLPIQLKAAEAQSDVDPRSRSPHSLTQRVLNLYMVLLILKSCMTLIYYKTRIPKLYGL